MPWTRGLPVCLLLLQILAATGQDPSPKYMVVMPALLPYPSSQKACIHLQEVQHSVKLSVTLETTSTKLPLLAKTIKKDQEECVSFQVPPPSGGKEEVVTLRVQGNGSAIFEGSKQVLIQTIGNGTFCQTDKPIYQPGQKVRFRIVTLTSDFRADDGPYSKVVIQDPSGNLIGQWQDVSPKSGIVDLSYLLPAEPPLGSYTIMVADGKASATFDVAQYVLPKFSVTMDPPQVYVLEKAIPVHVCSRYTYGKPVSGTVKGSLCQQVYYWGNSEGFLPICQNFTGQTDKSGCLTVTLSMTVYNLINYRYSRSLDAEATLTEDGTGVEAKATSVIAISFTAGTVTFEGAPPFYQTGAPYTGMMKVLGPEGTILKTQNIYLIVYQGGVETKKTYVTDDHGMAPFTLDTTDWNDSVSLQGKLTLEQPQYDPNKVNVNYQNAYISLQPFFSNVKSILRIRPVTGTLSCGQSQDIQVEYILNQADIKKATHIVLHYAVIGRGGIVDQGQHHASVRKTLKGTTSFSLTFSSDYAPTARILVYCFFSNGGITAANTVVQVSMCFNNQVTLRFSETEALPGSPVVLQMQAAPFSLCSLRAVDQSLLLLKPEAELSNQTVYNMFHSSNGGGYPFQVNEYNQCGPIFRPRPFPVWNREKRSRWWPGYSSASDVLSLFRETGLKCVTNYPIEEECKFRPNLLPDGMLLRESVMNAGVADSIAPAPILPAAGKEKSSSSPPRQLFPETWLWNLISLGRSPERALSVTAPDTITEWKASMFCVGQGGFGLAPDVTITTFKPFFVELTMPYSVVQGESFGLKASVFNYLKRCIKVQVTLAKSADFHVQQCIQCQYTTCLCTGETKTFSWNVTATKLGKVNFTVGTEALKTTELCGNQKTIMPKKGASDTVIKPLLVKPEGTPQEMTHTSFLCPEGNATVQDALNMVLPVNVVPGSARAVFAVQGDIMGSALQNLDHLIQMPSGCGEQNMLNFAPIIYVLQFLERTGQMTESIKSRAVGFLQSGYLQELQYKHADGSFSAFGERDPSGNTWLTMFVVKCFAQASSYIAIDPQVLASALNWLGTHQLPSGCFENVGQLFHTTMKGGVDDGVSLTAYIVSGLLEMGIPANDTRVANGLQCLKKESSTVTSIYAQALLAYAATLAKEEPLRTALLQKLELKANSTGDSKFWSYKPRPASGEMSWSQPEAVNVELTGYVILVYMSGPAVTKQVLASVMPAVRWLARQQNAYGGFASTQDTVVALQALAKVAMATFKGTGSVRVTVKSPRSAVMSFLIENKNRLLVQSASLTEVPGAYRVTATGTGCIFAQTTLRYNIFPVKKAESFALKVVTDRKCALGQKAGRFIIITITARYLGIGSRNSSNMAIIEVNMLSGFIPGADTEASLLKNPLVKRVEIKDNTVQIYVEKLDQALQTFTLPAEQDLMVKGLKEAAVKIYDYYQPEEKAVVMYNVCQ